MAVDSDLDIYQRLEREVRTPKRRLLLDAFLPPPESIESTVMPPPPPPPLPGESPEEIGLGSLRDRDRHEPPPEPRPKSRKKKAPPKKAEKPQSLQEEIEEFMKRDGAGLSPEDDIGPFQNPPIASTPKPEPDPDKN